MITESEFEAALKSLRKPRGRQTKFLAAHAHAKGRALNMRSLAKAAGYVSYRGANLQYGLLAERIGRALKKPRTGTVAINHLVEFVLPKGRSREHISNDEFILIMRPEFAAALVKAGWI
jgi:hypothetical protein